MRSRFWQCAGMTLLSALVSAGFAVQGLFTTGSADSFAQYAGARSIALLLGVTCALFVRSRSSIITLAAVMTVVQALDGIIGVLAHNPAKTYGPLIFTILNFITILRLRAERRPTSGTVA